MIPLGDDYDPSPEEVAFYARAQEERVAPTRDIGFGRSTLTTVSGRPDNELARARERAHLADRVRLAEERWPHTDDPSPSIDPSLPHLGQPSTCGRPCEPQTGQRAPGPKPPWWCVFARWRWHVAMLRWFEGVADRQRERERAAADRRDRQAREMRQLAAEWERETAVREREALDAAFDTPRPNVTDDDRSVS